MVWLAAVRRRSAHPLERLLDERAAQGRPPKVTDPAILRRVARLVHARSQTKPRSELREAA
jgi:hypothetical protein